MLWFEVCLFREVFHSSFVSLLNASTLSQVVKNVGHVVDESNDGAADGDDNVDKNENVVDEHVDDGLCVEVHLLGHRPVEVGVHKDDRQLHRGAKCG